MDDNKNSSRGLAQGLPPLKVLSFRFSSRARTLWLLGQRGRRCDQSVVSTAQNVDPEGLQVLLPRRWAPNRVQETIQLRAAILRLSPLKQVPQSSPPSTEHSCCGGNSGTRSRIAPSRPACYRNRASALVGKQTDTNWWRSSRPGRSEWSWTRALLPAMQRRGRDTLRKTLPRQPPSWIGTTDLPRTGRPCRVWHSDPRARRSAWSWTRPDWKAGAKDQRSTLHPQAIRDQLPRRRCCPLVSSRSSIHHK